jgi:IS1 family transposase
LLVFQTPWYGTSTGSGRLIVATDQLIDWECSGLDQSTFESLMARLRRWQVQIFAADDWGVYAKSIPAEQLAQSQAQTVAIERPQRKRQLNDGAKSLLRQARRNYLTGPGLRARPLSFGTDPVHAAQKVPSTL